MATATDTRTAAKCSWSTWQLAPMAATPRYLIQPAFSTLSPTTRLNVLSPTRWVASLSLLKSILEVITLGDFSGHPIQLFFRLLVESKFWIDDGESVRSPRYIKKIKEKNVAMIGVAEKIWVGIEFLVVAKKVALPYHPTSVSDVCVLFTRLWNGINIATKCLEIGVL